MYNKNILNAVYDYQYKYGITYPKTDSETYRVLRVLAIISFLYLFFTSVIYTVGSSPVAENYPHMFQVMLITTCIYFIAFVLMLFKLNLIAFILNITASVI